MEDQIINLAAINAITEPYSAIIVETMAKRKRVTFMELLEVTKLSNGGLTGQLEKLQKYSLIEGELTDTEDGRYSFYHLARMGKEFHAILHDALEKASYVKPDPVPDTFVIDAQSFKDITKQKTVDEIRQLFNRCKIIFTNYGFSAAMADAVTNNDEDLEKFLNDENLVEVSDTYQDEVNRTRTEYHLRRARKLAPNEARLVSTALDCGAALITDNKKITSAARSMSVKCANTNAIMELKKGELLSEKFYELSLRKSDPKLDELLIQSDPFILKKN